MTDSGGVTRETDPVESLVTVVEGVDEETVAALAEALREDPELIQSTLRDYGFLADEGSGAANEAAVASLTDSEQRLAEIVADATGPRSIPQLVEEIERDHPSFREAYGSYDDRSWLNRKLNALVEAGLIGKFRDGRTVVYTPEIAEAVRHWALHNNQFVEELSSRDVENIVADTGMPRAEVARAVSELTG
ncbi:MAG: hypothetical protein ABEH80_04535 [Halobaculum sp.]